MEKILTKLLTLTFHPLLFPTYYLLIIVKLHFGFFLIPEKAKWMILGLVFITTFMLPVLVSGFLSRIFRRYFNDKNSDELSLQLAIALFFYVTTYYFLIQLQIPQIFTTFILGSISLLVLTIAVSVFWNISVYMIASGALFGAFLCFAIILKIDLLLLLSTLIFLAGFMGYFRLKNSNHSPLQVYSGFVMGAFVMHLHFFYF